MLDISDCTPHNPAMGKLTIVFGILLIALGVIGFTATGSVHYTALIPAGFGVLLAICGALAVAKPALKMHTMHAAVLLGLIGFLGTVSSLINLKHVMAGEPIPHPADKPEPMPAAVYAKSIMCGMMLVYVILCVRSFIAARKARKAAAA